jgi:hypothetical protein
MNQPTQAEAAEIWQALYAEGKFETSIPAATNRTLRVLRAYLSEQEPSIKINLGLGLIENEMIARFYAQDDRLELDAQFKRENRGEGFL